MAYFVVERYWPGVSGADLAPLGEVLRRTADEAGAEVRYLGSVLLVDDNVVQCRFEGVDADAVRRLNDAAGVRYDRVLQALAYPP